MSFVIFFFFAQSTALLKISNIEIYLDEIKSRKITERGCVQDEGCQTEAERPC